MENIVRTIPGEFGALLSYIIIAGYFIWALIHIVFSIAVYIDARQRQVRLVGPFLWAFVTLFGGVIFAGVYWIVNRLALDDNIVELKYMIEEANRTNGDKRVEEKLKDFKSRFQG